MKNITHTFVPTKKKAKMSAKIIQNRINGLILIALGVSTLFFPMENGESDGTAFIMLTFIGLAALFSKE